MSVSKTTPTAILEALQKALSYGPAQKLQDSFYTPRPQPYYHHNGTSWTASSASPPKISPITRIDANKLRLVSWNIDMLIGFAEARMAAALAHLSALVTNTPKDVPIVIFLQEMTQSDMQQIRESAWIQQRFHLTDIDEKSWLAPLYGTTTLVDSRLHIRQVRRVPWISKFDRDGLFVDVSTSDGKCVRLCNTHLESLVADPPVRPLQVEAAAPYLHASDVTAGILAGDLNAIQPFDRTLHTDNRLKDVYLELGGKEDSDEGYTWGQQVPQALREKFGCSRMDKIFFTGAVVPKTFERVAVGAKVEGEEGKAMKEAGEQEWVTDHIGVMADFEIAPGWEVTAGERSKLA